MMRSLDNRPLPLSMPEARARGWDVLDVVIVTPDAYVDHPAFGAAVIGRVLEAQGLRVGIIAQPDWRDPDAFRVFGKPELCFGVSGGNVDSMLCLYTASKKRRNDDPYSPGARPGLRPARPTIVYSVMLRRVWPDVPLILGGVEAGLRRWAHYDYWSDKVRRPLLVDAPARLAVYGMGERAVVDIVTRLRKHEPISSITDVAGTVVKLKEPPTGDYIELPDAESVAASKEAFAKATLAVLRNRPAGGRRRMVQKCQNWYVIENPPPPPETEAELDWIYGLPFTRAAHPAYSDDVPALETVRFSIVSHRGCFGDCSFCTLALHQGPVIRVRSVESIIEEARSIMRTSGWKGRISDIGGPTANMYGLNCSKHQKPGSCRRLACLTPDVCPHLEPDQAAYLDLLDRVQSLPGVKSVTVGSGCRHDLLLLDRKSMKRLVADHVSGQLKVAPEHMSARVASVMRKPGPDVYEEFRESFFAMTSSLGRDQYLVPYLMAAHPGCTIDDMIENLEVMSEKWNFFPRQVQLFIPTPSSLSTAMYYLGHDPMTGKKLHVARSYEERQMQRALLQPRLPGNRRLVLKALRKSKRGRRLLADGRAAALWPFLFHKEREGARGKRRKRAGKGGSPGQAR